MQRLPVIAPEHVPLQAPPSPVVLRRTASGRKPDPSVSRMSETHTARDSVASDGDYYGDDASSVGDSAASDHDDYAGLSDDAPSGPDDDGDDDGLPATPPRASTGAGHGAGAGSGSSVASPIVRTADTPPAPPHAPKSTTPKEPAKPKQSFELSNMFVERFNTAVFDYPAFLNIGKREMAGSTYTGHLCACVDVAHPPTMQVSSLSHPGPSASFDLRSPTTCTSTTASATPSCVLASNARMAAVGMRCGLNTSPRSSSYA